MSEKLWKPGKSFVYINNWFSLKFREQQPWSSGMMLACHAGDPGSIPGERNLLLIFWMPHRARRSPGYSELQNHVERCWQREMVPD